MTRTIRLTILTIGLAASLWPTDLLAQRAVPRPPGRPVHGYGYARPYYPAHYYSPFYFSFGWYGSFGWYPYWGYPYYAGYYGYPYGPYPYGYPVRYEAAVDLRLQVTPRHAEVYLDGHLVGNVDSFDGLWQRLRVPYGEHDVAVYLEGYQTIHQKMLFRPGESYRIRETMRQLPVGQQNEPRPVPIDPPPGRDEYGREGMPPPPERGAPPQPPGPPGERAPFGTVSIRVQPADAEILIDGEKWENAPGDARILVQLAEGTHRIEIRREGYRTYATTIRLRRGETLPLNVSLPSGGGTALSISSRR